MLELKWIKVLSLFDGISCARVALERVGIEVDRYFASEIDKYAIQVSRKNYPSITQIGDVKNVLHTGWFSKYTSGIDLLIWGSPCQDLSIAKKNRKWLDGERSWLFWEYVRILKAVKPKYFILENVNSMPKKAKQVITETLGVEPIMINASLVSAQSRKRLFRTNIPWVAQPEDKYIFLKDVLEDWVNEIYQIPRWYNKWWVKVWKSPSIGASACEQNNKAIRVWEVGEWWQGNRIYSDDWKSIALSATSWWLGAKTGLYEIGKDVRKLTPIECERLQGLSDNYTSGISNSQRYKCLGNAFNVDVVAHILSFLPPTK